MTLAMGIGLGFALLVGLLIWIAARANSKNCKYDERQIAAQGKAYKAGFVTFIGWEIVEFFIELFTGEPFMPFAPGTLRVIEMLVCILVYLEEPEVASHHYAVDQVLHKREHYEYHGKQCRQRCQAESEIEAYCKKADKGDRDGYEHGRNRVSETALHACKEYFD